MVLTASSSAYSTNRHTKRCAFPCFLPCGDRRSGVQHSARLGIHRPVSAISFRTGVGNELLQRLAAHGFPEHLLQQSLVRFHSLQSIAQQMMHLLQSYPFRYLRRNLRDDYRTAQSESARDTYCRLQFFRSLMRSDQRSV